VAALLFQGWAYKYRDGRVASQGKSVASSFLKDEFRTTKAGLDALLGD
jgi:hypothetical protein